MRKYSLVPISFDAIARKDIAWHALPVLQRILMRVSSWTRNETLFRASFAFASNVDSMPAGCRFRSSDPLQSVKKKKLQSVKFFVPHKISQRYIYVTQKYETCSKFEWIKFSIVWNWRFRKNGNFKKSGDFISRLLIFSIICIFVDFLNLSNTNVYWLKYNRLL